MAGRAATAFAALVVAGCGASDSACRKLGEDYPDRPVRIAEALDRDGELVSVRAALIARQGRPERICTALTDARPPSCRGPSLRIEGLRDTSAFEHGQSEGDTVWWESVTMAGRVDGDTIRYELTCRARDVQRHLADAIGDEPSFNAFASNAELERLDYAPLPELMPPELRARYGYFGVGVSTDETDRPVYAAALDSAPDVRGVYWTKERDTWIAVKHYGDEVALVWAAGRRKRLDERWERLDGIMRDLD